MKISAEVMLCSRDFRFLVISRSLLRQPCDMKAKLSANTTCHFYNVGESLETDESIASQVRGGWKRNRIGCSTKKK